MIPFLRQLFIHTIYEPAEAARTIRALDLDRETLWTMLALACVLNTLMYFITNLLFPAPETLPLLSSPGAVVVMLLSITVISIYAFYWIGLQMGGSARLTDIIALVTWLQFMRVAVQVGALVLMLFLPGLAVLLVMAAGLYGVWIMISFIQVAHGFETRGQAFMLLIFSALAIFAGMLVFLAVFGAALTGLNNV